ncbi:MAG: translation elongation factor 4, partial [Planctomycetota bacterium]
MDPSLIRNFSIIAHIDHGKSTLADQLLLKTGAVEQREFKHQMMDSMALERERGITIKANGAALNWKRDGKEYRLNLIDTPGHVDFSYEVSRSLMSCEGAILVVDAAQGVAAQTVANMYLAVEAGLDIIPVINKVDLPNARVEEVAEEMHDQFGIEREDILMCSAKTGMGVPELIDAIIDRIPPPKGDASASPRALIFDAQYDDFRGVIVLCRMVDGTFKLRDKIRMMATKSDYEVLELGLLRAKGMVPAQELGVGEVGYLICNIKELKEVHIGDTVAHAKVASTTKPLPGFRLPQQVVYCGIYPTYNKDFELLRKALDKLALNDCSFTYTPESSDALGFGFRCGFLGLLHMDIVQERLERESGVDIVQTAPNVTYEIVKKSGETIVVHSPAEVPDPSEIGEFREPIVRVQMVIPSDAVGTMMMVCEDKRGVFVNQEYLSRQRVILTYDLPLAEILYDFYDKLKSGTRGYGTMDFEVRGFFKADLVKMTILINKVSVDALSVIMHR